MPNFWWFKNASEDKKLKSHLNVGVLIRAATNVSYSFIREWMNEWIAYVCSFIHSFIYSWKFIETVELNVWVTSSDWVEPGQYRSRIFFSRSNPRMPPPSLLWLCFQPLNNSWKPSDTMPGKGFARYFKVCFGLIFFADRNPGVRVCQKDMVTESNVRPTNASIYHVSVDDVSL